MELAIIISFVIGYFFIALEHPLKVNKTASALVTGVLCWTLFMISQPSETLLNSNDYKHFIEDLKGTTKDFSTLSATAIHREYVTESLGHHLNEIAQILFFLMGAMTIVELVDSHKGFKVITNRINTKEPKRLLWIICWVTFFLSAVLDNLTTTIVMVSLTRKVVPNRDMRLFFAGMIIIAANAGGAWSPIGDVTTTMLWIGGQISALAIIKTTFLASTVCLLVPLLYLSFTLKGTLGIEDHPSKSAKTHQGDLLTSQNLMLALGMMALVSVPIFKTLTHLPPYLGMMLGLGLLWIVSEFTNVHLDEQVKKKYSASHALSQIDMSSVLFFLGILLAVGALQSMGVLESFSALLDRSLGDHRIIITLIGIMSAIIDNVPLVAASMAMYNLESYPMDHQLWEYLAYCAGTGGSILVIGSAAGVAAMGMEKIDFIWYLKRISVLAALGYFAGAAVYLLQYSFTH